MKPSPASNISHASPFTSPLEVSTNPKGTAQPNVYHVQPQLEELSTFIARLVAEKYQAGTPTARCASSHTQPYFESGSPELGKELPHHTSEKTTQQDGAFQVPALHLSLKESAWNLSGFAQAVVAALEAITGASQNKGVPKRVSKNDTLRELTLLLYRYRVGALVVRLDAPEAGIGIVDARVSACEKFLKTLVAMAEDLNVPLVVNGCAWATRFFDARGILTLRGKDEDGGTR